MEASLSVQRWEGSKILSRDGGGAAAARGRSASWARPAAWYRRALGGGLHLWSQPAAVEAPAAARARGRPPLWRSSLKAVGSALARVLEEEYATRRRVEMQAVAKRSGRCWFPPGPSRLSQMSMANDGDVSGDDGAGENSSSTSSPGSEAESI